MEACAPTGIAAARLNVPRTPVRAYTAHTLFKLNILMESTINPTKALDEGGKRVQRMTVLIADEHSMFDDGLWAAIVDQLTTAAAATDAAEDRAKHPPSDDYGAVHMVLAGDFKQLPPATSRPPFIASDTRVVQSFSFRVLRQNRRLASSGDPVRQAELEEFHGVLEDVSKGKGTEVVQRYLVEAYVRGAQTTQKTVPFEGSTACFATRRHRDRWNKVVLDRSGKCHKRSMRVKASFAIRGTEAQWVSDASAAVIRRSVRSQSPLNLRLAGQWLDDPPLPKATRPHCMRAMLVANINVANAFANGTIGRVVWWGPEQHDTGSDNMGRLRKPAILVSAPGVQVCFYEEEAMQSRKKHFLPEVDFIDIEPRREDVVSAKG